ncbi:uncharacterized protein LOC129144781 [Talpa occidentalis]|uniref:uncharacterized protein LOC129144781 n=1 Tax=Talpa occidentalis TaxID=50954 RepID=UPI0023F8852B|nr:uncharacterized protein LOC129144781 [Talpa occidentalis]
MAARPISASRRGHQPPDQSWERLRSPGGSPSPPPASFIFPPDGVTGAASPEGDSASFSPTQRVRPPAPVGAHSHAHSRTHTRTRGSTRTGSHTPRAAAAAAGTCSDGIATPQPGHAFAVRPPNPHLPGASPPTLKKSASPPTRTHTHTKSENGPTGIFLANAHLRGRPVPQL